MFLFCFWSWYHLLNLCDKMYFNYAQHFKYSTGIHSHLNYSWYVSLYNSCFCVFCYSCSRNKIEASHKLYLVLNFLQNINGTRQSSHHTFIIVWRKTWMHWIVRMWNVLQAMILCIPNDEHLNNNMLNQHFVQKWTSAECDTAY